MAALNIAETEALRDVIKALDIIIQNPDMDSETRIKLAKNARDKANMVVQMKGHYYK